MVTAKELWDAIATRDHAAMRSLLWRHRIECKNELDAIQAERIAAAELANVCSVYDRETGIRRRGEI